MTEENPWAQAREASQGLILQVALADLESKAATQEREFLITQESLERQKELNSKLLEENASLQASQGRLSSEASKLRMEVESTTFTVQSLEESRKQTQERFDRMQAEGDALREEISRLTSANAEYQQKIMTMESQAKLGDSQVLPLQFQVDGLRKEVDVMSAHNTWLNGQWQDATQQLAQTRQSHAVEMADLRSALAEAQEDQASSASEVTRLDRLVTSLEATNERLATELRDAKTSAVQLKVDVDDELQGAQRLIRLQKTQLELLQNKHDGLATQLEAIQRQALEAEQETSLSMQVRERDLEFKTKQILESQAQAFQQQIAALEDQLTSTNRRLKDAEDGLLLTNASSTARQKNTPRRPLALRDQPDQLEEPLNLTELYVRLAETEDHLRSETLRRKKAEISLQRIEAEMVEVAPRLLRQRKEYEDAMERENTFRTRLDAALDEAQVAREEAHQLHTELTRLQGRNQELEGETQELAKQVQKLLVSRSTSGAFGAPTEPSSRSVTPPPEVIQMQQTNQKLAGQVRKLTSEIQELHGKLDTDILRRKVDAYEEELSTIREDRKRQEVMATSLAQQRDLYRALLAKHDVGEETTAIDMVKKHSEKSKRLEHQVGELEQKLANANAQLATVDHDKNAAGDRLARYEEVNKELSEAMDRLQTQTSQLHADVARAQAEVTFYQNKTERLEDSLERSKNEASRIATAKSDLQRINGDLQASLSKAHAEVSRYESELNQAKRMTRLVETQKEQAKAAEQRLTEENDQLRSNIARQGALIESIQRIENSLSAKAAAEEESYKTQVASLTDRLATVESQSNAKLEALNAKLSDAAENIKDLEKQRSETAMAVAEAKEEAMKFLNELQAAKQKCTLLESQLRTAKRKLGDTSEEDVEGELRSKIAALTEDLTSSLEQVEKLKERCSIFERLAKDNEAAVAEQTAAMDAAKEAHSVEIATLQSQLDAATTQYSKSKEIITELTNDLSSQRDERTKELEKMDKTISELKAESEQYQKDAESTQNRYAQLEAEVMVLRTDVVSAQTNYERELALHSAARSDLRATKEMQEAESRLRKIAEEEAAASKAELTAQLTSFEEAKAEMQKREKEHEKTLEETRAQNTLLHGQLEKINEQIEKIQSAKGGTVDETEDATEASSLQKTVSELREVVKFVRADKEMIQNQLDSARRAAERERAAAAIAKRSLEEARVELKVLQESARSERDTDGLKEKLNSAEQQVKILGESNSHLREEVTKLESKLSSLAGELDAFKAISGSSEQRLKDLETDNAGYQAEKKSLLREIDDWKGRVQSLVSKFNQVDPAEHAALQKKAEALAAQVETLESQKVSAEDESKRIRMLTSRVSKELTQNKVLIESYKKTIASLTEAKEALDKAQKDDASKKDLAETKEKLAKMETERANEKIQLTGAQEMNDKLRDRLRVFQKTIMESKQKESLLEKELKDTKEELLKTKKAPVMGVTTTESVAVLPKPPELKTVMVKPTEPKPSPKVPEQASDEKPAAVSFPPEDASKEVPPKMVAKKSEITPVPTVPPGGFMFGPSPHDTKKPELEPKATNKRLADAADDTIITKKAKAPEEKPEVGSDVASEAKLGNDDGTQQDGKGETNEVTMKEKLLEKKRKLALAMEKKKQREKEAAGTATPTSTTKEDLSPKKAKVDVSSAAKTKEVAQDDTQDDVGKVIDATDTVEDKMKAYDLSPPVVLVRGTGLDANANPFAPSPFGGASFGSASRLTNFGTVSSADQSASTFGSGSTHPVFSTGFGGDATALTSAAGGGFGGTASAGVGGVASAGFGSTASAGVGGAASAGFGSTSSAGVGSALSAGFGSGSSSFLDMKPPGSSTTAPTFTFGSSATIILPTPANPPPKLNPFGAFSGQVQQPSLAKPLFSTRHNESPKEEVEDPVEEEEEGEVMDGSEECHET